MKNKWPYGIAALFLGFVSLMIAFAVIASQNKGSLVVKNYYQAEIAFQQQIDKQQNANALAVKPSIKLNENKSAVEVFFPLAIYADGVKANCFSTVRILLKWILKWMWFWIKMASKTLNHPNLKKAAGKCNSIGKRMGFCIIRKR